MVGAGEELDGEVILGLDGLEGGDVRHLDGLLVHPLDR